MCLVIMAKSVIKQLSEKGSRRQVQKNETVICFICQNSRAIQLRQSETTVLGLM